MKSIATVTAALTRHGITFLMGLAAGLPLLLTVSLLQAWMVDAGISLEAVGMLALLGVPYTLKFLWAPLLDRYELPILGRRRGWLALVQILLIALIVALALSDPALAPGWVALLALGISFLSASQDIVIDAYRREHLPERELGVGSSFYTYGYRIGMLLVSGGGMLMADAIGFGNTYLVMAAIMAGCLVVTLLAPEPHSHRPAERGRLRDTFIQPISNFLQRPGAWWLLLFILLYKLGDSVASNLTIPFYKAIGFSNAEIGATAKIFGFWPLLGGIFIGGLIILRLGIYRSLWWFGLLQMVSTAGFIWLNHVGHSIPALAAVVSFENAAAGMGTAAFLAFMAALTDKRFTAAQYALLSSIMGLPRAVISAPGGILAEAVGWDLFFLICTLVAIPGLAILWYFRQWRDITDGAR
ncbi:AmpG family muropeptide MFS transporter [Kushneria aurantia]|uniref:MFS transporter n=1 Tax=Kushneria aurantia TaxID=504092 RepID=A0ABV6G710_9GAMM|nr:MFS transporter [Kushneria aurantia]